MFRASSKHESNLHSLAKKVNRLQNAFVDALYALGGRCHGFGEWNPCPVHQLGPGEEIHVKFATGWFTGTVQRHDEQEQASLVRFHVDCTLFFVRDRVHNFITPPPPGLAPPCPPQSPPSPCPPPPPLEPATTTPTLPFSSLLTVCRTESIRPRLLPPTGTECTTGISPAHLGLPQCRHCPRTSGLRQLGMGVSGRFMGQTPFWLRSCFGVARWYDYRLSDSLPLFLQQRCGVLGLCPNSTLPQLSRDAGTRLFPRR